MNLNELRQRYRLALLNQDVNRLVELENAFCDAGGSPRDVVMQKEWAGNDVAERFISCLNDGFNRFAN